MIEATTQRVAEFAAQLATVRTDEALRRVVATRVPGLVANRFLPHWPHPRQLLGLAAGEGHPDKTGPFVMLFGGAAGGGKSDWLLQAAAARAVQWGHYRCLILRRTYAEMMKAGAIMSRALDWWLPRGVDWSGSTRTFTFPSGAKVEFGYHSHPTDNAQFQGGEWHDVFFDELTHWPDGDAFDWLRSRLRTNEGDPIGRRELATSNPGEAGHAWVKARFIGGYDLEVGGDVAPSWYFLPSRIEDNPTLNREAYEQTLLGMHPTRRRQLLDGDWDARPPGDFFRVEWFGPLLDALPAVEHIAVRWWDLAASESTEAARTAGVRMVRLPGGACVVTHATAFRATPGSRDAKIVAQAKLDGRGTVVGLEIEPGSGGVAQFEALASKLQAEGFRVVGARPRVGAEQHSDRERAAFAINSPQQRGKEGRADPVASALELGYQRRGECPDTGSPWWGADIGKGVAEQREGIRLIGGPWTQGYVDELEGFPGAKLCDLVDATSGAHSYLRSHAAGYRMPPGERRAPVAAVAHDTHPDDRPDDEPDGWKRKSSRLA